MSWTHIAGIVLNDTANAPGICTSVYVSGCEFHCKGCHNQDEWDFNYGNEATIEDIFSIEKSLHENGIERGLCILGGEPLHRNNLVWVQALISYVRMKSPQTKIYLWTGNTFEDLMIANKPESNFIRNEILSKIDVLIDGPYIEEQRDITLKMRGSKNQRIIYLTESKLTLNK